MTKRNQKKHNGSARPIRSKRDFEGASAVVKRLSGQSRRDSAAELRLQALLHEMDEFDAGEDDAETDIPGDGDYSGPRRRWSDDGSGSS
jgi:hypothetical protein